MSDKAATPHPTGPVWEAVRDGNGSTYARRLYVPTLWGWLYQPYLPHSQDGVGPLTFGPDPAVWTNALKTGQTDLTQVIGLLHTINQGVINTMATLADIKTELDALQVEEQKLEAFAVATQTSLADVQAQLAAAIANAADPAALQAISDEIAAMQAGVEAALPVAPVVPPAP